MPRFCFPVNSCSITPEFADEARVCAFDTTFSYGFSGAYAHVEALIMLRPVGEANDWALELITPAV
jgi:hypothetical protein